MPSKKVQANHPAKQQYKNLDAFAIAESKHSLSTKDFDRRAVEIVNKLEQHGYQAFIVGGAVRDLLCHIEPKDYDIATNAHPEQIRGLFKNSRLIGRRFRIVHLYYGRNIIEVATFRAAQSNPELNDSPIKITADGQLTRDNAYGTIEEDAVRRDFSANALYYSPSTNAVYDFTGGFKDIKDKQLRVLGDPLERYREDPVRMLRAIRFSCKLDFTLEEHSCLALESQARLLLNVSNARLFDESIKLFHNIHAEQLISELRQHKLFDTLFPFFEKHATDKKWVNKLLELSLRSTQQRLIHNKPVTIAFLYAVLLWPEFLSRYPIDSTGKHDMIKLNSKAMALIQEQSRITLIPKRHAYAIKDMWEFQIRLAQRKPNKIIWIMEQKRFRAAFDFLQLREASGETPAHLASWWEKIQFASPEQQRIMIQALKQTTTAKPRRKRNSARTK